MTFWGWVVLMAWAIGGLPVGVAAARWMASDDYDRWGRPIRHSNAGIGFSVIGCWVLAPLVAVLAVGAGLSEIIGRLVRGDIK